MAQSWTLPKWKDTAPEQPDDPQGFIGNVVEGLKSIPHLPAALIDGVNDPKASPQEIAYRKRALAEASQWVVPAIVSGAVASIPATGGASVLIGAVADAIGMGVGSGLAAHYEDQDPVKAGLLGAVTGGVVGGGIGALKLGGAQFAEQAAKAAAAKTADEAAAQAAQEAASRAAANTADIQSRIAQGQGAVQPDLFDFGLTGRERQTLAGELPRPPGQTQGNQLNLFADTPENPSSLPTSEMERRGWQAAYANRVNPQLAQIAAASKSGGTPSQALARVLGGGEASPTPRTFGSKPPKPPDVPPTDGVLALHEITPTVADATVTPTVTEGGIAASRGTFARGTYAADQVLKNAGGQIADAITRGDLHGMVRGVQKGAEGITLSDTWREAGVVLSRALEPARKTLQRMGPAGTELAATIDAVNDAWQKGAGEHMADIQTALSGMSKPDRIHVGEILEGLAVPKDPKFAQAADAIRSIQSWYADAAQRAGIRQIMEDKSVREFTPMANFLPHYIDKKAIESALGDSPAFEAVHDKMVGLGQSTSQTQTRALLRSYLMTPPEFRTGPLNFVRGDLNLPYDKDPLTAMTRYVYDVRKRIEAANTWGANYRGVLPYYERIGLDGGDPKVAQRIFSAFNNALPQGYNKALKAITTYNTWTMLSTTGIVHMAQMLNTAGMTSYASTLKAVGAYLKNPATAEYLSTRAGVHINGVLNDLVGAGADGATNKFLKYAIGLEPVVKANRIISAVAGRFELDRLAGVLQKAAGTKGEQAAGEAIERIGGDPAALIANNFVPTDEMYRDVSYKVATSTQHAAGIMNQPEFMTHPIGKILYQFRSFALRQSNFLNQNIMQPATLYMKTGGARGSLAPLARYAIGLGPAGTAIGELVRGIKGTKDPAANPTMKMVENMSLAGGFGIYYDMVNAMKTGKDRFLSFLAGPGVSEIAAYAGDAGNVAKGNTTPLAKHLLKRVPVVGQTLSNYWFYPRTQ